MTNPFDCIANNTARYFTHQGINCMTQLGPFTINGYIELPENHPWLDFPDMIEVHPDIEVHGGITYHTGRVIGFDTNHLGDGHHPGAELAYQTGGISTLGMYGEIPHIWTWEEVEKETRKLADQAKDANHAYPRPPRIHRRAQRAKETGPHGMEWVRRYVRQKTLRAMEETNPRRPPT